MKVSEKTLELNIGAELLAWLRSNPRLRKAYLRGLTQAEERREGADFFAQLNANVRLYAFQFKAPKGRDERQPYRYTIVGYQHAALYGLARRYANSVFYVFPYFVTPRKVHSLSPTLLSDTWFLDISGMPTNAVFAGAKTRTVTCISNTATVNPEYKLLNGRELHTDPDAGIPAPAFAGWYNEYRGAARDAEGTSWRSPWLARGLRIAIAPQAEIE